MSISKLIVSGVILFLISACTTLQKIEPPGNENISWKTRQQQIGELTDWKIRGAIALRQGKKAENASFYLQQNQDDTYELAIYGPLGIGRNVLTGEPERVMLKNNAGKVFEASNAELLIHKYMGWTLPVSNLHYWVRGIPAPGLPKEEKFDQYYRLSELQQQGWSIRYESYMRVEDLDLPRKIIFHRQEAQLTIVISRWEIK